MSIIRKRGGRAPLDENGSTTVTTRFGQNDLARLDEAWPMTGEADRSAFIRQAVADRTDAVLDEAKGRARRIEAIARKHDTAILTAPEAELFAAAAELIGRRTPYAWGGGSITGPSLGVSFDRDSNASQRHSQTVGFDAGSLEGTVTLSQRGFACNHMRLMRNR